MNFIFLSYHHFNYSRSGGMIELAKAIKLKGHNVSFIFSGFPLVRSFSRTNERLSFKWLTKSTRVIQEEFGIFSAIWVCFGLFGFMHFKVVSLLNKRFILNKWVIKPLILNADVLVVESCFGLNFVELILEINPKVRIFYRPSDPIAYWSKDEEILKSEKYVISKSEAVLVKNAIDFTYYTSLGYSHTMFFPNYVSLDITHFETQIPSILESNIWKKRVALYVGVMSISWEVVFNLSSEFTDWNFVIVIPAILKRELKNQISNSSNVFWINGVERKYVPSLIKNCDLFLVPYVKGFSDKLQWGLTVKYLTAMYYKKLILAINDNPNLVEYGISICNDELELINSFKLITRNINKEYDVELLKGDWMQNAEFLLRLL